VFKIPLSEIIAKIKEKSGLTEADINAKIEEKLKLLSGLISKEGAAHIVANELGIRLIEQTSGKLQIKNIMPGMRDVETVGRVMRINPTSEFTRKDGTPSRVTSIQIGDETGSTRIVMWGDQASLKDGIKEGDIVKVLSGLVKENRGFIEVHLTDRSKMIVNPSGETVGTPKHEPVIRKKIQDLNEQDINVELLATVVQVFDLRFFEVCPQCNSRAREREGKFYCGKHDAVEPNYSYVLNLVLDDGTETIRSVFFRNNVDDLLQRKPEETLLLKDDAVKFDEIKNDLLGTQILLQGRVNKNEMFNRMEFMVKKVNMDPDPAQEIKRLENAVPNTPSV